MKKVTKYLLILLTLVCFFVWASVAKSPQDNFVHLYILNVGQGDAILIERGEYQILIDGGPDDKVLSELGRVMPALDRTIEQVILTHPHADHLTGLNQVLDRYAVGTLYTNGVLYDSNTYMNFLDKLKQKNIEAVTPKSFSEVPVFESGSIKFIWPGEQFKDQKADDLNETSIVTQFCYFAYCALLTGDVQVDKQVELLALAKSKNIDLKSDLLKVSHHGSINGTNQALLDTVLPKLAVISVGAENKFGHPHAGVIDLLNLNSIKIFRDDRDGGLDFAFSVDGIIKK